MAIAGQQVYCASRARQDPSVLVNKFIAWRKGLCLFITVNWQLLKSEDFTIALLWISGAHADLGGHHWLRKLECESPIAFQREILHGDVIDTRPNDPNSIVESLNGEIIAPIVIAIMLH